MITSKKAMPPVIAVILLLVFAVFAVVGFQGWYNTYSSDVFSDLSSTTASLDDISIEALIESRLYINFGSGLNVSRIEIDSNDCSISGVHTGLRDFDVSSCLGNERTHSIIIITNEGVLSGEFFNARD